MLNFDLIKQFNGLEGAIRADFYRRNDRRAFSGSPSLCSLCHPHFLLCFHHIKRRLPLRQVNRFQIGSNI